MAGPTLSNCEALLLAQAVWEHGTAWSAVARVLTRHPLIARPKSFFNAQSANTMYNTLLQQAGIELTESCSVRRSPVNQKLAEKFYAARLEELRTLILAEETKFKAIVAEIEEIRTGKRADLEPFTASGTPADIDIKPNPAHARTPAYEAFEGSDLSGITGTSPAASHEDVVPEAVTDRGLVPEYDQAGSATPSNDAFLPRLRAKHGVVDTDTCEDDQAKHSLTPTHERGDQREEEEEDEVEEGVRRRRALGRREEEEEEDEPKTSEIPEKDTSAADENNGVSPPAVLLPDDHHEVRSAGEGTAARLVRRRSVASSTYPPRKSRRQQGESPAPTKVEPEDETNYDMNDVPGSSPPADRDFSPAIPDSVSRRPSGVSKRKAFIMDDVESPRERKRMRDDSEPVEEEEGAQVARRRIKEEQAALKKFQQVIGMLHQQISQHRNGNIFHNPIKTSDAPDYHDIVKRPIDLKTIKMKVKDGVIMNSLEYQRDILLMFANAMMYNRPGSDVHTMAEEMMLESENHVMAFRQTEGLVKHANRI